MKIIGLSGTNGSGKDTVAAFLAKEYGYFVASASEMLAAELKKLGQPADRKHKRELGNQWRRENVSAIVDKAIEAAKQAGNDKLVVGSLRNPGEADRVHELGGTMIWVDADSRVRYQRISQGNRGRIEDQKTYEEFLREEATEMNEGGDKATLNMAAVKEKSDIFLKNNFGDIGSFEREIQNQIIDKLA